MTTNKKIKSSIERIIKLHDLKKRNQLEDLNFLHKFLEPHYRSPALWKCYEPLFTELFHESDLTVHLAKSFSIGAACVNLKDNRNFSFELIYKALQDLVMDNLISVHFSIVDLSSFNSLIVSLESIRDRLQTVPDYDVISPAPKRSRISIIRREVVAECTELLRSVVR